MPEIARAGGSPRIWRLLLPAAAFALPLLVTAAGAWLAWRSAWRAAEAEVTGAAEAAAEYARRTLDGLLLRADMANEVLRGLSDEEIRAREEELHRALRRIPERTGESGALHIFVHDREARSLVSGSLFPVPPPERSFEHREFNAALRGEDAPRAHVSPAYLGEETHRAFFAVSRRREGGANGLPPGAYDGVIAVSTDVAALGEGLGRLVARPENGDILSLTRFDGQVLARSVPVPGPLPRVALRSDFARAGPGGAERGTVYGASLVDGVVRLSANRRVEGWPLFATAARPRASIVARWAATGVPLLALGGCTALVLLALALAVRRGQHRLAAANAGLERRVAERTAAMAESAERMRLALATAALGVVEWDMATGEMRVDAGVEAISRSLLPAGRALAIDGPERRDWVARIHPEDQARRVAQLAALQAGETGTIRGDYRVRLPPVDGEDPAEPRIAWITYHGGVVARDPVTGRVLRMIDVVQDVTDRKRTEEALAEGEARLRLAVQAARMSTWELDLRTGLATRSGNLVGDRPGLPRERFAVAAWLDAAHPEDRPRLAAMLAEASAGRLESFAVEYRIRRAGGEGAEGWMWLATHGAVAERDPADGAVLRLAGIGLDVTARKEAEQRLVLLAHEVDHRAKNALSVVQAALRLTPRDDVDSYARAVEGRVRALARAHGLLAEGRWEGAALRALVEGELALFLGGTEAAAPAPRVEAEGPDLLLAPTAAQALSMALHELATNATKYGALSMPGGQVSLAWSADAPADLLRLRWTERGGPLLAEPPARRGFGSRVIEATVRDQLRGRFERRWETAGLVCDIEVPLSRALAQPPEAAPAVLQAAQ